MRRLLPTLLAALLGCSIDSSGLRPEAPTDGGGDADRADATIDAPQIDGGPTPIVGPLTLGTAGPRNAHPAVVWTGAEFVVAYFQDDGAGGRNVIVRASEPGRSLTPVSTLTMTTGVARSSLSLAHSDSGTAIGWVEGEATGELHVRVLPSTIRGTFPDVEVHQDFDDAQVMWDRGALLAIVRQPSAADETLTWVELTPGPGAIGSVTMPRRDFGELAVAQATAGPLVVVAEAREIYLRRDDLLWHPAHTLALAGTPMEGDVAELSGGALVGVFGVDDGTGLTLRSQRLEPRAGGTWDAVLPDLRLSTWLGPDAVVTAFGADRALVAWADETSSPPPRPLALAVLDLMGAPTAPTPCIVPAERAYANDPDIACGAGWCAVVWMEADELVSDAYVTRFAQLPIVDPDTLGCPAAT